jgi:hypothetical protein
MSRNKYCLNFPLFFFTVFELFFYISERRCGDKKSNKEPEKGSGGLIVLIFHPPKEMLT